MYIISKRLKIAKKVARGCRRGAGGMCGVSIRAQ